MKSRNSSPVVQLLQQDRPLVMGILNTTPDSFSDGGEFVHASTALDRARQMIAEGADIIDVGGESTRPGAEAVNEGQELSRVIPVIEGIRRDSDVAISIDTSKAEVMRQAVAAGADMINDVNALRAPGALDAGAQLAVPVCLMHMQGEPRSMQANPVYENVVGEIREFLQQRIHACVAAGIDKQHIIIDPGFGFGKTLEHNLSLLKHLAAFNLLELPVLVGISRKSMLGKILDAEVDQRLYASIAAAVLAWERGAKLFRVHDVKATVDALKVCRAMNDSR
jgi:dihydropteroate synthase